LVVLAALLAASVIYAVRLAGERPAAEPSANRQVIPLTPPPPAAPALDKSLIAELLGPGELAAAENGFLALEGPDGRGLFARTTLDFELQAKALQWISQVGGVRAALVAVDPMSGRVLALAGTNVDGRNSALSGTYPAASVFKIITAAAAVEKAGLSGASVLQYDGAKHTLYKSNVVKGVDQGIHKATLRSSFAESVNSVFGKLGAHEIGGQGLLSVANRFGFNRRLNFEMPLEASVFDLGAAGSADPGIPAGDGGEAEDAYSMALAAQKAGDLSGTAQNQNLKAQASFGPETQSQPSAEEAAKDPAEEIFHLAELASGFNRVTKISPVHGALMAAAAINGGILYEPTVISEVFDKQNEILYQSFPAPADLVLGEEAASELRGMMTAAVHEGTGRKQFSDALDHRILSKLELGGKSGSINDEAGSRVDWFVAFARPFEESSSAPPIALAAVVVHEGNARLSSQELIRRALLIYYGQRFKPDTASQVGAPNGAEK
jgi:cell division protein FtsI/penicillin-binding protein 2